jgi:autoinducer 2 (AI-2) kinase
MSNETDVVLVVDIGTSSGRAALVDRSGSIRLHASHRHSLSPGTDGSGGFDAPALLRAVAADVGGVLAQGRDAGLRVAGVAATSVRGAFVLLDAVGSPIWSTGSLDDRATAELEGLLPAEEAFHEATGQRMVFAALPRLRGLAGRDPGTFARARRLSTIDAWLTRWLTGVDAMSAPSAAPTGLLHREVPTWLEPGTEGWRPSTAELALLPPVVASGTIVGHTRGLDPLGLADGIPVAAGGGDAQLAALGLGCVAPGDTAVIMGSHWQSIVVSDRAASLAAPGRLIHGPAPATWHADTVTMRLGLELDAVWPDASADGDARTAWRRVLEDGCARVAVAMDGMIAALPGVPRPAVVRVGGGAPRDPVVRDVLAATLGERVEARPSHEASVLGAAMCAAVAAGWAGDVAEAAYRMLPPAHAIEDPSTSVTAAREA